MIGKLVMVVNLSNNRNLSGGGLSGHPLSLVNIYTNSTNRLASECWWWNLSNGLCVGGAFASGKTC